MSNASKDPSENFATRHIGPDPSEVARMLEVVGAESLDALVTEAMPASIRSTGPLALPDPLSEREALRKLGEMAGRNRVLVSMIGQGYHGTVTPPVIQRNVLESPAWYTAYTPYQAEISQGRLEALLNFQTMVSDLTGLEVANASLLDEGTAAAEAMAMAHRLSSSRGRRFLVDRGCHPQTVAVVSTRAEAVGIEVAVVDLAQADADDAFEDVFGVLVQYPATDGVVADHTALAARAHDAGALVIAATDLLALTLIAPPGEWGADIAVGSSQRFGVPLMFGGPHAAFIATRDDYVRSLPGRLVGVSIDTGGRMAYRLALQTREQHIRRERATSNVCTAQVLLAVIAGFYAAYHGAEGLTRIARRVHESTARLAAAVLDGGYTLRSGEFFDTLVVDVESADVVVAAAQDLGVNLRRFDDTGVGVSLDETTTEEHLHLVLRALGLSSLPDTGEIAIPSALRRTSEFLTHPVFSEHRSEHEMLRYLRRLSDKDLALDRTMIPLGSCTMKLNATSEMIPIGWEEFSGIHPYAPLDQAAGYLEMIEQLEQWLCEITGYDAVSLQPNAGSQGEFAGLLAIRAYHRSRGDDQRDVCLIPSSAHGTNAASAVMAGMRVVVVACDENGDVDLDDLSARAAQHAERLAAIMVTYPSTHGVFEEGIVDVCRIVHEHGGQVYVDGANLNALVGLARPGEFGADVSHLNLHKTFTIPHGGGGPGVGPIGVKAHLAPFLPGDPLDPSSPVGPVASARWGSAGILPIPWVYIAMMGAAGLTEATKVAILAANYVASRLGDAYPVLYAGKGGRVAHECIVDIRPVARSAGTNAEDVAKRLSDHAFHAPTVAFPVAGTLMIEPTESESLEEIDRFCEAMLAIREEIRRVEAGEWPQDDNPLVNAPHPAEVLVEEWAHPYTRREAVYPTRALAGKTYFPPVGRIDSAGGDRNLVCSCPPIDSYVEEMAILQQ